MFPRSGCTRHIGVRRVSTPLVGEAKRDAYTGGSLRPCSNCSQKRWIICINFIIRDLRTHSVRPHAAYTGHDNVDVKLCTDTQPFL